MIKTTNTGEGCAICGKEPGDSAAPAAPPPINEGWRMESLMWAVERWRLEVENRPLVNVHRRSLDDTWRQVMRHFGGKPELLVGPDHDTLLAESEAGPSVRPESRSDDTERKAFEACCEKMMLTPREWNWKFWQAAYEAGRARRAATRTDKEE